MRTRFDLAIEFVTVFFLTICLGLALLILIEIARY